MKTSIKLFVTVLLLLTAGQVAFSQQNSNHHHNCSSSQTSRSISLENSSKNEAIKINVSEKLKCLNIAVTSSISSGSLKMEIYNPNGDKQGNFSVESTISSSTSNQGKSSENVCGQLNKSFKEPMKGEWVVKFKPKKATGKIQIHSYQVSGS